MVLIPLFFLFAGLQADAGTLLERLRQASRAEDYGKVEALAQELVAAQPDHAEGWFYLGYARAARKDYARAIEPYQRAIRLGLDEYKTHYQLGFSAHMAGRHGIAVPAFRNALRFRPGDVEATYLLGVSQYELGDFADADRTLSSAALREGRRRHLALFYRALARIRLDRVEEAREDLQRVARESPDDSMRERAEKWLERLSKAEGRAPDRRPPRTRSVVFQGKIGYDSNVLRLPETSITAATEEDDLFIQAFLMGSAEFVRPNRLVGRLSLLAHEYLNQREFSVEAALGALENEVRLGADLRWKSSAHFELYTLDQKSLFRRLGVRTGPRLRISPSTHVSADGLLMAKDYRREVLDDLDATEYGFGLEVRRLRLFSRLDGLARYEFAREDAEAPDRSFTEHKFQGRLEARLSDRLRTRLDGRALRRTYDERDRTFGETREDVKGVARLSAIYRLRSRVELIAEVQVEGNDSTIGNFDYDRTILQAGFLAVF
jgi:tetratricopeptide (TPR) repeat protein